MNTIVDDVGSFPFPKNKNRENFNKAYILARNAIIEKKDFTKDPFIEENFSQIVLDAFRKKLSTGLDCVNFPQMYNGIKQIVSSNFDQHLFFDGKDEFYEISLVFNEMAEKLKKNEQKKMQAKIVTQCNQSQSETAMKPVHVINRMQEMS